jgi:diguanylate cyclase
MSAVTGGMSKHQRISEGEPVATSSSFVDWLLGRSKDAGSAAERETMGNAERFRMRHGGLIEQICNFLADAGLDPIPDHYELAWLYIAGGSSIQRLRIDTHLLEFGRIDAIDATKLLDEIRTSISEREFSHMVEEAKERIGEARATTEQSSREAASFGASLGISLTDLDDPEKSKTAIVRLQKLTAQMIERAAKAEATLQERSKTMGQLRSRLVQSQKMALSDALTDLPNRRAFDINLKEAMELARTRRQPLSVGFCDIDHFKAVNDTHGHATGDRVIRFVADALRKVVGPKIHVARHGGEEFALIFPHLDAEAAAELLDQARTTLADKNLLARDTQAEIGHISFSAGVAELRSGENSSGLLMRADNALYRAKESGRNRVLIAP